MSVRQRKKSLWFKIKSRTTDSNGFQRTDDFVFILLGKRLIGNGETPFGQDFHPT